jgi:hypothetical protein
MATFLKRFYSKFSEGLISKSAVIILALTFSSISQIDLFAQSTCSSVSSGNWNQRSIWSCGRVPTSLDNAVITSGTTVTLVNSQSVNNLTIAQFGTLNDNNGPSLTVAGDLTVNGAVSGTPAITLNGVGKIIDGTGNLSNTSTITIIGNKTIASTAELSFAGGIIISGTTTVTNNGVITISGIMNGTTSLSSWENGANSVLNVGASTILATGILNTSASGNTINYYNGNSFTLKTPSGGVYHHLIISGGNTKTLPNGTIIINGDLTINGTLSGNGGLKVLRVRGNWINNSSTGAGFTEGAGIVIFDGSNDQYITKSSAENFHNLIVEKNGGILYLNTDIIIGTTANLISPSTLTMTSGIINAGENSVTIGKGGAFTNDIYSGKLVYTSGKIIGRVIRYIYDVNYPATTDSPSGSVLFPLGTNDNYRPADVAFNSVSSGTLTAEFNSAYPGNNGLALPPENGVTIYNTFREGYWTLTTGIGLTSSSYNLSLTGDGFGTGQININDNTRLLTRANSNLPWTLEGVHQSRIGNIIRRSSLTTLSAEYCFGSDNPCVAPVTTAITGNDSVCTGTTGMVYAVTNNGNSYVWKVDGGTIASGQNTSAITVNWGNVGMTGNVSVIESNSCTTGAEISLPITISPFAPVSVNGRLSVPANGVTPIPYSVNPIAGYTYNWSVTGGTPSNATGNDITVVWGAAGTGSVCVTGTNACGTSSPPTCISVNKYTVIRSVQSGNWSIPATWDCGGCTPQIGDNIMIMNTHSVIVNVNGGLSAKNVIINPGGTLSTGTGGNNRTLTVDGDLTVDGTLGGLFNVILNSNGSNPVLDGNGNITNTGNLILNKSLSITISSSLTKPTGNVLLGPGVEITNNGNVTLGGNLEGTDNTSIWVNKTSSLLSVSGTLLSIGMLEASEPDNTVAYSGATAQTLKTPQDSQYSNLLFSGAGIKTASVNNLLVSGNLTNNGTGVSGTNIGFNPNGGTIIFNGNSSINGVSVTSFQNIVINGLLTSYDGLINISGNFTNNGTFNHNNGTVVFNGTVASSISGSSLKTTFYNLTANNSAGLTVEKDLDLINILNVGPGAFIDVDGASDNRQFTLKSSGDNSVIDASVGVLSGANAVRGKLTVERFISNEGRLYRYLSSPVQGAFVSDWMDDFPVTGLFPDKTTTWSGQLCNGTPLIPNNASLFYYNESAPGNLNQGYVAYPIANGGIPATTSALEMGRGYAAFIRVCPNEGLRVDLNGEVYQGTLNLPVSYTVTQGGGLGNDGWNLLGNPYASAIDWDVTGVNGWTKTNLSNSVAVTDNASGMMHYWDGVTGSLTGGVIASGQAFWVQATAATPVLTIREGVKVNSSAHQFYRKGEANEEINSVMQIALTNAQQITDHAFVKVRERVSFERDNWDANKLENGFPEMGEEQLFELATITPAGTAMAINAIPSLYEGMVVPLLTKDLEDGKHQLHIKGEGDFITYQVVITDSYTNSRTLLKWNDTFEFVVNQNEPESFNAKRFSLQLVKIESNNPANSVFSLMVYPNPVSGILNVELANGLGAKTITVYNNFGGVMMNISVESEAKNAQIDFSSAPTGVYLLRLTGMGYTRWAKVIKH